MRISNERPVAGDIFIATLTLGLALVLGFINWWRYTIFRNDVDLGIFTQVIAGTGGGFSSTAEGGVSHMLVHWSPIIVAMWPLLHLFGPVGLQFGQACLVAATLVPVWALARARLGDRFAVVLASVAALYPLLWANAVADFHEMAFVPLLSATLVYAIDRRKWFLGVAAVVLLLCTKEDQFVILACAGLTLFTMNRSQHDVRRFGLLVAALAALGALLYFLVVRPHIDPSGPYLTSQFYDLEATQTALSTSPTAFFIPRLDYVLIAMAPLVFLPFISRYGLFLVPGFIEILASHRGVTLIPGAHYSALLTGFALAAFVDGFDRLRRWSVSASAAGAGLAAAIAIGIQLFASPMAYWYYLYRAPDRHDALLERTLRTIPSNAYVGAEDEIFAHLGLDPHASAGFNRQPFFVYDGSHFSPHWRDVDQPLVRRLVASGAYNVLESVDGIVVLRRAAVP